MDNEDLCATHRNVIVLRRIITGIRVIGKEHKRSRSAALFSFFLYHPRKDKSDKSISSQSLSKTYYIEVMASSLTFKAESHKAQCVEIMADDNFNGNFPEDASEAWVPKQPNFILQLATPHSDKRNVCLIAAHYPHPDDPDQEGRTGISYDLRAHNNLNKLRELASNKGVFQGVEDCVHDNGARVVMWFAIRRYPSVLPAILNSHF